MTLIQPENEDYRWLLDALGGYGSGDRQEALVRPSSGQPELFIPMASPLVASASLRRYHDGRSHADRAKTAVALAAARSGLLRFAPGEHVQAGPFASGPMGPPSVLRRSVGHRSPALSWATRRHGSIGSLAIPRPESQFLGCSPPSMSRTGSW